MKKILKIILLLTFSFNLLNCGGNEKPVYEKTPLDKLKVEYFDQQNYSIILKDMDFRESDEKYLHKYQIIIEKEEAKAILDSTKMNDIELVNTDWIEVSDIEFDKNKDNLGMTILSKKNGVLDASSSPAGYDNYVGNKRYGQWETNSSGESFWSFYGKYYMMTSLFRMGMGMGGFGYNQWNDYDRNYRGNRRYDGGGSYGTNGRSNRNSTTTWAKKPTSFKDRVRSKVNKSATLSKSRGYSSNSKYSKNNSSSKTSRNSSRYSGSSSRSRGGGFGK